VYKRSTNFSAAHTEFPSVPEYRRELAATHNSLGNLLAHSGRWKDAEAEYGAALALKKQLAAEFPDVPEHRQSLARSHICLGGLLIATVRPKEAERELRAALALQNQLAASFPTVPEYRRDLALSHYNLGILLARTGLPKEAEAEYRSALAVEEQLAADFSTVPAYRQELARSHNSLGSLLVGTGRAKEAEAEYRAALALQRKLAGDFPSAPNHANSVAGTLVNLSGLCLQRKDFAAARKLLEEARPHHEKALQANAKNPTYREFFRNNRWFMCDVLLGLVEHAALRQEADELARFGFDPKNDTYNAACYVARYVPLAEKDEKLGEAQRKELPKTYADRALALLREAVRHGYTDAAHMKKDPDLTPLRGRTDFQQLLAELEKKPPAKPGKP